MDASFVLFFARQGSRYQSSPDPSFFSCAFAPLNCSPGSSFRQFSVMNGLLPCNLDFAILQSLNSISEDLCAQLVNLRPYQASCRNRQKRKSSRECLYGGGLRPQDLSIIREHPCPFRLPCVLCHGILGYKGWKFVPLNSTHSWCTLRFTFPVL
jgi:hypothetical protein